MKKIKVITLFSGYDSQLLALRRLKKQYPQFDYECVGWCEIDKYAIKAHNALFPEYKHLNLGDITKLSPNDINDCDLMTWSFPCTDISSAGKQSGLKQNSGTRSSLCWDAIRLFEIKKPKYLVMENVRSLLGRKFKKDFRTIIDSLEKIGYTNYWQILDSRNYGVPQHRERVFIVSILNCQQPYYFPKPFKLEKRLKDVLEQNVEERYYLSEKAISGLLRFNKEREEKGQGFRWEPKQGNDIGAAVLTTAGSRPCDNYIAEPCIAALRGRSDGDWHDSEHRQKLEFKDDGTSNTITSVDKDNMVIEPAIIEDFYKEREPRIYDEAAPTVRSEREGLKVVEPVMVSRPHGYFNGNIYDGISPTVKSSSFNENNHIIEPAVLGWVRDEKGNVVSRPEVNVANCVTAGKHENTQNYVIERAMDAIRQQYPNRGILIYKGVPCFVRRLSTRELFRLMDVDDLDIDILLNSGIAKTQLAKLAGNSVVCACYYHILRKLFIDTNANENEQLQLF